MFTVLHSPVVRLAGTQLLLHAQAPTEWTPAAATVLMSYIAYPFQEPSMRALALEAGQALARAAASLPQGHICLARCLSQDPPGTAGRATQPGSACCP